MRVFSCLVAMATLAIAADERALRDFVHSSTATVPRDVEGCSETDITIGSVVEGSLAITDCSLRLFNPGARIGLRTDLQARCREQPRHPGPNGFGTVPARHHCSR